MSLPDSVLAEIINIEADIKAGRFSLRGAMMRVADAALEEAAKLVDERHDIQEPWMCGDDIRAMKSKKT